MLLQFQTEIWGLLNFCRFQFIVHSFSFFLFSTFMCIFEATFYFILYLDFSWRSHECIEMSVVLLSCCLFGNSFVVRSPTIWKSFHHLLKLKRLKLISFSLNPDVIDTRWAFRHHLLLLIFSPESCSESRSPWSVREREHFL